ncbi:formate-dependent phosphoribosylglycinamide formyltransferase [Sulfurimonas sp.]|jgi:phosphoribosylglycinamide formyltransferase 2|uniref:formate-dependent phosphoribosylglycinamide formyltransferase n=1 Tax=Sulfurimonas sp. TaxID=2022749 RepID=UPI0025EB643E|nr:formate-dependent phosphoribosylglycinamide formyltransferase [Sulfurimonas sp.]MCK9473286.1 formate-dependent phosphoribosylglycinamide formyltransferase [Sulfurimonas sp.]
MQFSAPLKSNSKKIMLLGSGELGREVAIEAQRLGLEVIAVDRYQNAPAHHVAHRTYVVNMQDKDAVLEIIYREKPDYILPEIEAISIDALFEAEDKGYNVIPNASAVSKTMNRKNIRTFAAEVLKLKTGAYEFVTTKEGLKAAALKMGFPCVIKPVMSSSGHGQSVAKSIEDIDASWETAKEARGDASELIVEAFVDFDYEITMVTARNGQETIFCEPIGHEQRDGDYVFSWQPMQMSPLAKERSQEIAKKITDGLGGRGLFGVELFVKGDEVYFSEVSPRPHDTGMVTLITQSQSEFALHLRAVLGLPLGFTFYGEGASAAFKSQTHSYAPVVDVDESLFSENSFVRIFSKPEAHKGRRLAVALVFDKADKALKKARELIKNIKG